MYGKLIKVSTFILSVLLFMVMTHTLFADDNCKDVNIRITNNRDQEIKVTDVWYYDYDLEKWRKEYTWTALRIAPGVTRSRTRNLEHVDNDKTKLKFHVKIHLGGVKWQSIYSRVGEVFTCHDGCTVHFIAD
jgi:hypothetical protein